MIGQKPWVGGAYQKGYQGQKLLLVGYAHRGRYGDAANDPEYTRRFFFERVLSGTEATFAVISDAFGGERRQFWQRVAFAQVSPTVLLEEDERYAFDLSEREQIDARFYDMLDELKPDKLIVLSHRAWELMPRHSGHLFDEDLFPEEPGRVRYGSYCHNDFQEVTAYRLPHARFADPERLRIDIAATLAHVPPTRGSQAQLWIQGGGPFQQSRATDAGTRNRDEEDRMAEACIARSKTWGETEADERDDEDTC